jgi:hypothetical protein
MFEQAVKNKYRFSSRMGNLSVEDLWDLDVQELDNIYKELKAEEKQADEESLLTENKEDDVLTDKIAIIKYIVEVKLAEIAERKNAIKRKEEEQQLLQILAIKKAEELQALPAEEIQKRIDELRG